MKAGCKASRGWSIAALIVLGMCVYGSVVDPADFGFSPDAPAATNAAALQKALDGGRRVVRIARPGVYGLDRTVFIDSDTEIHFGPGVVLQKRAAYANILVNRGAFEYSWNTNITVRGLRISVNGFQSIPGPDSAAPGLRGQFALYRVRHARIYDFSCLDMEGGQYCFHIAGFEDVILDGFDIRGKKDGVHVNAGRNFAIRNGVLQTGDDGIALNAGDWPGGCTPIMGSIEDGVIENIHDLAGGRCNFARVITGVWTDWHTGMRLQRGDIFRVGKNVYAVHPMPLGTNEYVSLTAPAHTRGVWKSPEGINFQYLQNDGETRADIRNVVFRDLFLYAGRTISCSWEIGGWARLIHPEIKQADLPVCDITVQNVFSPTTCPVISGNSCATLRLDNIRANGPVVSMTSRRDHPATWRVICTGTYFGRRDNREPDFRFSGHGGDLNLQIASALQDRDVRLSVAGTLSSARVNGDASVNSLDNLTPKTGDAIKAGGVLKTFDGTQWR